MNKLVSKNPVLRFKLGNKIQKAGLGDILKGAGDFVDSGALYGSNLIKRVPGIGWAWGKYDNFVGSMINPPKNTFNQRPSKTRTSLNKIQTPLDGTYYEKTIGGKVVERGRWKNGEQIPIKETTVNKGNSTGGSKKGLITRRSNNYIVNPTIQNRAAAGYILPEGITSVADTQTMLKNAGFDLGKYGVDGIWGRDTLAAYDAWKNSLNSKVNPTAASEVNKEFINIPLTASVTSPATIIPNIITAPQITYDRTGIRQLIRDRGFNPYLFSGALRRALRMVMNGQGTDTDRAIVSGMGIFKKGGLISKNPIKRFKNGGIQKFLKAGNLPTAPKAEDRYRGGLRVNVETKGGRYGGNDRVEIKEVLGKKPGMFGSVPFIRLTVVHSSVSPDYNDTTYIEVPERKNFLVLRKLRGVEKHPSVFRTYYSKVYPFYGSILPDLGSGSKLEYETLKQRFNTAWNIAK